MAVVLALQARGLGDLLTAVPALRALRRARPGDHLVLAAPRRLRPVVDLIASVDAIAPTGPGGELRWDGPRPELAVNLHGPDPASILALAGTEPGLLLSYRSAALPQWPGPELDPQAHRVQRWCALLEWAGMTADPRNLGLVPPVPTVSRRDCVVVHVGAGAPARRWPADRFAAVVRHLLVLDREVVLTGDEHERELALQIAARAGLPIGQVLAGEQTLLELAATVAEAELLVCGETGVAHLATAFGTRTVLLFGPTSPRTDGPPPHLLGRHAVLWAGDCGDPEAREPDAGLLRLGSTEVIEAVDKQLGKRRWPGVGPERRRTPYRRVG
ncbi:glycosyltransferase family 9 protein [Nocardia sp. NPDC057353]|uniref:glycosyltransferase family 9 protein n=1 Tax=Nocardia sp. NPDC057353 TaxID=3346104 RepID=UPI003638393E